MEALWAAWKAVKMVALWVHSWAAWKAVSTAMKMAVHWVALKVVWKDTCSVGKKVVDLAVSRADQMVAQ